MRMLLAWVAAGICWFWSGVAGADVSHVFLIQNSGWMEPFYLDANSQFKPLAKAVITTVAASEEPVLVAAFNQSIKTHRSPQVVYRGQNVSEAADSVDRIALARKPESTAYADTDFKEAVTAIAAEHLRASPAVIWIFTNNKNSPGNDLNTAARNREFYDLLHVEPAVARTLAFPLGMPVRGKVFSANGLMVYALAYGQEADSVLRRLVSERVVAKVFTETPARLKPLDRESVSFVPRAVSQTSGVRASLGQDGHTIQLEVDASLRPLTAEIVGAFRNDFFPYAIRRAAISAKLVSGDWSGDLTVMPSRLDELAPNAEQEVTVSVPIPGAQIPSMWSLSALSRMGTDYVLEAGLHVALAGQELALSDAFAKRISSIFPGDPLPDVFKPSDDARASTVVIPVRIRVVYPLYPLVAALVLSLAVVGVVAAAVVLANRERRFDILINGQPRKVAIKAFRSLDVRSPTGEHIATLKRRLGRPAPAWVAPGTSIQVRN